MKAVGRWLGAALLSFALVLLATGWRALGKRPDGERLARIERSAQWHDGRFQNPEPLQND